MDDNRHKWERQNNKASSKGKTTKKERIKLYLKENKGHYF